MLPGRYSESRPPPGGNWEISCWEERLGSEFPKVSRSHEYGFRVLAEEF